MRSTRSGFCFSLPLLLCVAVAGPAAALAADVTFTDATDEVFPDGLTCSNYLWGDCDGDGDDDLLSGAKTLYINQGAPDYRLTRKTDTGDLSTSPHRWPQWIDIDNDGDLDIFGAGSGDNERLLLNDGSCSFTDISDMNGDGNPDDLGDGAPSVTVTVGDYDADGYLDAFVGNYELHCDTNVCADCTLDALWRNLGDNTLDNVYDDLGMAAAELGAAGYCVNAQTPCDGPEDCAPYPTDSCKIGLCARSSKWVDFDGDGHLDLYVGNYRLDQNFMWRNDGAGGFTNVAPAHNLDGNEEEGGVYGHTLGVDWGDYDNDGDMDVYIANLAHAWGWFLGADHDHSELRENDGHDTFHFEDVRPSSGMYQWDPFALGTDWSEFTPAWADYDNDGNLDIYVTHGYITENYSNNRLYRGHGDGTFTETTTSHGANLALYKSEWAAWADFDNDGDVDLVTCGSQSNADTSPREPHLFRNDGANADDWIQVVVAGRGAGGTNASGVGVRLEARDGDVTRIREIDGGHGYHVEHNSYVQTIGLGDALDGQLDELRIRWTDLSTWSHAALPVGLRYTAYDGARVTRGTTPAASLPDLAGALVPYFDRVLGDGETYFYRIEGAAGTLHVSRDDTRGAVVLTLDPSTSGAE